MWKWMVEFLSKFQGCGIKIDRVNSMSVAKSVIFFNILRAIASGATSSWAIVFFVLRLFSLVYILCTYTIIFLYCIVKHIDDLYDRSFLFSSLAWGIGFWMWRLTLACGVLFLLSAEYYVVMCGACTGNLVTWLWHRLGMIYCSSLRFWSQICVTSGVAGPRFWSSCLVPGQESSSPRNGCIHTRWIRSISQIRIWVELLRNGSF